MKKVWVLEHFGKKEYRNQGRIVFFKYKSINYLQNFFNVPKNKIKVYIYYNLNYRKSVDEIRMFWSKSLKIPAEYIKIYTYKRDIKRIARQSEKWGICQLRINDVDIRNRIENFLSSILQKYYIDG